MKQVYCGICEIGLFRDLSEVYLLNTCERRFIGTIPVYDAIFLKMMYGNSIKNYEKYLQARRTNYFWALRPFQMFTGPIFQMKQHWIKTVFRFDPLAHITVGHRRRMTAVTRLRWPIVIHRVRLLESFHSDNSQHLISSWSMIPDYPLSKKCSDKCSFFPFAI